MIAPVLIAISSGRASTTKIPTRHTDDRRVLCVVPSLWPLSWSRSRPRPLAVSAFSPMRFANEFKGASASGDMVDMAAAEGLGRVVQRQAGLGGLYQHAHREKPVLLAEFAALGLKLGGV